MYPITVDPREGSGEFLTPLHTLKVQAVHGTLEYGDFQIIGRGPEERPVAIGVERKAISDLLRCIQDQRFVLQQLEGLRRSYEQVYLLVEGVLGADARGGLTTLRNGCLSTAGFGDRQWTYTGVWGWLFSQLDRGGIRLVQTVDHRSTALWLRELWATWNLKAWEDHKSHLGVYWKPLKMDGQEVNPLADLEMSEAMKARILYAAGIMKGIGYDKAKAAAAYFPSKLAMAQAEVKDWKQVPGIGAVLAKKIYEEFRKEEAC